MSEKTETRNNEQTEEYWFVDIDGYEENDRSFSILAAGCLCSKCRKKLKADTGEVPVEKLIEAVRSCCSKQADYITSEMPVLESVFRIILANGNKPLKTEDLAARLMERRGSIPGGGSGNVLLRLLKNDGFYGINSRPE